MGVEKEVEEEEEKEEAEEKEKEEEEEEKEEEKKEEEEKEAEEKEKEKEKAEKEEDQRQLVPPTRGRKHLLPGVDTPGGLGGGSGARWGPQREDPSLHLPQIFSAAGCALHR
ncbi:hypothetical protein Pmani_019900 [Petrolisthes manimaculis]|uniref:Uncharacterized protein n=1 Tax=Petrolisthes manimaculis TaxID=1843537 RepID=A0AAE1PI01_9EUCA|nr:hypothetical protein Pmani_019900 [Petrolisthes manimaculis]